MISEQAKREAWHRMADELPDHPNPTAEENASAALMALTRVLQEHSDVAKGADKRLSELGDGPNSWARSCLQSLILPDEPDVLGQVIAEVADWRWNDSFTDRLRGALDKAGYQIVPKDQSHAEQTDG